MGDSRTIAFDIETASPIWNYDANRILYFESGRRPGKYALWEVVKRALQPKFVQLSYRKGKCFLYALALAFHLSYKDSLAIVGAVSATPCSGVTLAEVEECLCYAEAIYKRKVEKLHWRGTLFNFCRKYSKGLFLVNCSGHIGVVFNGTIFGSKLKNYNVYNAWCIELPNSRVVVGDFMGNEREILRPYLWPKLENPKPVVDLTNQVIKWNH